MQYTAPLPAVLGPGKDFSADVIEDTFTDLREALNGTIGCYHHPDGGNIVHDNESIEADTLQPGACVEVSRTDPFIVGPQSFVVLEPKAATRVAFAGYQSVGYPAGASVTFVAGSSGKAFVTTACSFEDSSSSHMIAQPNYVDHTVTVVSTLHVSVDGGVIVEVPGSAVTRMWTMDGSSQDSHQSTSPTCFGVYDVSAGSQYSFFMKLTFILQGNMGGGGLGSEIVFIQLVGNGSSATAILVKV